MPYDLSFRREKIDPAGNPVCNLHHHAFACRDAEETRQFYEDVLGMPLVAAIQESTHPRSGAQSAYLHLFFEMADGTCLAFFDYPDYFASLEANQLEPRDSLVHHIALEVQGYATIELFKQRLAAHGVALREIDHGYCRSLYFVDPNGLKLELTDEAKQFLIRKGSDTDFGARPLRRALENFIEDPVSEELLKGEFEGKDTIQVDCIEVADKKQLSFKGIATAEPVAAAPEGEAS